MAFSLFTYTVMYVLIPYSWYFLQGSIFRGLRSRPSSAKIESVKIESVLIHIP